ncbi:3'-5' exonuclease [Chromobacterium amazonense]|uniref:3'-5' exonuclease n=1 Tax=Chromobacterium amazonense TaxID=1382803 RepID=UPI0021B72691|nr:3'-5' exonuclease [Chromobacterium amazonense]MDE1715875.1 exonuclease domain-containing protein [Chromobacterium amazonense]
MKYLSETCLKHEPEVAVILIIDLEATCADDGSIAPEQMEIIEVGAVWATPSGEVVDRFQSFVRPVDRPYLTDFCSSLTQIEQADVDHAPCWLAVAKSLSEFATRQVGQCWGSWGKYDARQIERECARHDVGDPLGRLQHVNLKASFAKRRRIKQVGMAKALQIVGLPLDGTHHRGLDDALNVARLLPYLWSEENER